MPRHALVYINKDRTEPYRTMGLDTFHPNTKARATSRAAFLMSELSIGKTQNRGLTISSNMAAVQVFWSKPSGLSRELREISRSWTSLRQIQRQFLIEP